MIIIHLFSRGRGFGAFSHLSSVSAEDISFKICGGES